MAGSTETRLDFWDYISMSCLVILSSIIGIYHVYTARKSKVTKDFLVTSTELGLFPLIMSTVATFFSAIGMLGTPVEIYMNGLSFTVAVAAVAIAAPLGCFLFLPVLYKLNRSTIFEYLELRFSKSIRTCASALLTLHMLFYTACVVYAPALALNQVTGLNLWASVASIGVVCIIYTSMGGIKAVVWADVTQCIVMICVLLVIIIKGAIDVGGMGVVWERLKEGSRSEIFIWTSSPHSQYSFWTMTIAYPLHILPVVTLNQSFMQRYLSNKTIRRAKISFMGGAFGITAGQAIIFLSSALMYAYFHNCDPKSSGQVNFRDQMMAVYAVETLSFCRGLPGVYVAGIMCATLSTLSSALNSLTAITLNDYIKIWKPDLSDVLSMKLSRYLAVVYGVLCMALVVLIENMGDVLKSIFGINSISGGPILVIFTAGMLLPWVNSKGAMIGFWSSIIIPLWAWIGGLMTSHSISHAPLSTEGCSNWTAAGNITQSITETTYVNPLYTVSALWYTSWSLVTGLAACLVVSKLTGFQDVNKADPDLFFPFVSRYIRNQKSRLNHDSKETDDKNGHVEQPLMLTRIKGDD